MLLKLTTRFNSLQQKKIIFLLTILILCIFLTIGLDLLEAKFQNSSFYFSESFLFSSFWWLFVPLLYVQFYVGNEPKTKTSLMLRIFLPTAIHLFAYPLLVWIISGLFYYHRFAYLQTLQYALTQYVFILCAVYTIPFILYKTFKSKTSGKSVSSGEIGSEKLNSFATTLAVADGSKRLNIITKDIIFISSNPPYLDIHHKTKKYIHKETLKSISEKLDHEIFVRVHKSTIVNIKFVQSYKSRLNGDYDLLMIDGTEIRLSRNFAANFKLKFAKTHQDTP